MNKNIKYLKELGSYEWDDKYFETFTNFIVEKNEKITDLNYILSIKKPNIFKNLTNYVVELSLKGLRSLK